MPKQKSFTVVARNQKAVREGVTTSRGRKSFNGKSALQVYDQGEAEEIQARHKRDVNVIEDERHEWHLKHDRQTDGKNVDIHHYTFSGVDTSHFKVWVVRNRKLARVTKAVAKAKGYKIVSSAKQKPEVKHGI